MMDSDLDSRFFGILQRRLLESRHVLWPARPGADAVNVSDAVNRARASRLIGLCDRASAFAAALRHTTPVAPPGEEPTQNQEVKDENDKDDSYDEKIAPSRRDPRGEQNHKAELLRFARAKKFPLCSSFSGPGLHPLGAQMESGSLSVTNFTADSTVSAAENALTQTPPRMLRILHIGAVTTDEATTDKGLEPVAGLRSHLRCANASLFHISQLKWKLAHEINDLKQVAEFSESMLLSRKEDFRFAIDTGTGDKDEDAENQNRARLLSEATDVGCTVCYAD